MATTYVIRIQYRRRVNDSPNVVEEMKNFTACMMQYNKSVILLPYHDKNKNNPLITARDIPTEVDEFGIYIPTAAVNNRSNVLFMKFKIQSNMPLNKLKQVKGIRNFLDRRNIYLDQMYLTSSDNAKIGGFIMSH